MALFLNGPLLYSTTTRFESPPETIFIAFLLFTCVSYLFISKISKTFVKGKPLFLILSVSLMTAGTLMVGLEAKEVQFTYKLLIFVVIFFVFGKFPLPMAVVSTAFLPVFSLVLLLREAGTHYGRLTGDICPAI